MIILVYGRLEQAMKDKVLSLKTHFYDKFDKSQMNYCSYDVAGSFDGVLSDLSSPPFLAEKKMVVLENFFTSKFDEVESVLDFLESMPEDVIVVLTGVIGVKDLARRKVFKRVDEMDNVHKYEYDDSRSVYGDFLNKYLSVSGLNLDFKQKNALIEYVTSISQMKNLLDQLIVLKNEPEFEEFFMKLVPVVDSVNIFDIIDALQVRNLKRARNLLDGMRLSGVAEPQIQAMWSNQVSYMIALKKSGSDADLAGRMGVHPFVAKKLQSAIRGFSENDLEDMHERFLEMTEKAKKIRLSPEVVTDNLLFGASIA